MSLENVTISIIPESIQFLKMSDEEYFSDKYKDYISNSKLGLLNPEEGGSREKFNSGFDQKYSPSFELGSAVHAMILQPEYYRIVDYKKPNGKLGVFAECVYKHRQNGLSIQEAIELASSESDYYSGKLSETRLRSAIKSSLPFYLARMKHENKEGIEDLFLSETVNFKFEQCMKNVTPDMKNTLFPVGIFEDAEHFCEYAILAEIDVEYDGIVTRVKVKGKLDNAVFDHENEKIVLNDLKTTGKPVTFFMGNNVKVKDENGRYLKTVWYDGSFQHFHYYRQMGMYLWLLCCYCKTKDIHYKYKANMVVIETIPEFKSKIYPVSAAQIKKGLDEFKQLIVELVKWKREK